jgi:excisionase family DNA binding protein
MPSGSFFDKRGVTEGMHKLLRPEQVAERCNYSVFSIRRLAAQDIIPHRRFGRTLRFDADEIERWLQQIARGPKVIGGGN